MTTIRGTVTVYNGEAFFVRHAYFTGADKPYESLKRTLRAEVDETAWESIYGTKSIPFSSPPSGEIAVKVINHHWDEVLKVYKLDAVSPSTSQNCAEEMLGDLVYEGRGRAVGMRRLHFVTIAF